MATIDEIKQQAEAVKNATKVGENTAMRVGGALAGLADIAKQQDVELAKKANTADVERALNIMREEIGERTIIEGNVDNNPDEEDLTSKTNPNGSIVLSLKDREYNPLEFSGKGYKLLRKNLQEVTCAITKIQVTKVPATDGYVSIIINGVETHVDLVASTDNTVALVAKKIAYRLSETMDEYVTSIDGALVICTRRFGGDVTSSSFSGVNTGSEATVGESSKAELRNLITAVMMNQPNTIYEIRYDFDLDGETIGMKEGVTLKFEGGNISNGILVGNNTIINKRDVSCVLSGSFLDNVSLKEINNVFRKTSKCKFEIKQNFINYSEEEIYNIEHFGLNKGVFDLTLMYDSDKNFQINSDNISLSQLASIMKNLTKKADIHEIKFYINKKDWGFSGTSDHEIITNYTNKLLEVVTYLDKIVNFDTVYIANEWYDFSVKFTDENRETFISLVNQLKAMGKKVGCTYQGFANMIKAEENIYAMLDCPAFNFYPRVFFGADDEVNENMDFSATIKELFDSYIQQLHILGNKKRIIVSEIGISYQNRGLAHPASVYDGMPSKPEFSLQMYVYYKSLIKALSQINEDIEVNLWYCDNIKLSMFDKILNELYYE